MKNVYSSPMGARRVLCCIPLFFFGLGRLNLQKRNPFGIFFKFFLDTRNMKRLSSMHLTWARKKIHEREYGFFFKYFLDSLILKRPSSFTFSKPKNKSMEEDHRLSFYLFFGVVKIERKRNHIDHNSISLSCSLKHERE